LDDAAYFDPLSLSDFSRAFGQMQAMTMRDEERRRLSRDFVRRASVFSWETFVKRIMDRVEEAVGSLSGARPSGPITVRQRGRRRTIEGAAKMESSQCERAIR
jgi:hypothetical protein